MDKNFWVFNASAGSGKTYNLARIFIEELIRKKDQGIDANLKSILAITFTHKAANEMKERVLLFLERISKNDPNDEGVQQLIEQLAENVELSKEEVIQRSTIALDLIMENFSQLSISTIDSFSHRIIRSFSKELNLHYDFDVSLDTQSWIELAVDRIFDRFGSEEEEDKIISETLIHFFLSQFESSNNWNLKWMVRNFALKNINEELQDVFEENPELNALDIPTLEKNLKEPIIEFSNDLEKYGSRALELIQSIGFTQDHFYRKGQGVVAFFKKAASGEDIFKMANSYVMEAYNEENWLGKKPSSELESSFETIHKELSHCLAKIIELKEGSKSIFLNHLIYKQIHFLAISYFIEKELNSLREEENILLIGDFNRLIEGLIRDEEVPFIYEKLGERYKHFLLDEFQDTALKQWHNFIPLIDNAIATSNRNLIVGDPKQAIYRFRNGEVELFTSLPDIYGGKGKNFNTYEENLGREYKPNVLKQNFRSNRALVAFNNTFFSNIKTVLGPFSDVYKDGHQIANKEDEGYVKVEVLDQDDLKEEDLYLLKTYESILECQEDGYKAGDIAVLTSTRIKLKQIAQYLSDREIEVVSDESLILKNQEKIALLISILKYIVDPGDIKIRYAFYRSLISIESEDSVDELQKIQHENIPLEEKLMDLNISLNLEYLRSLNLISLLRELEHLFKLNYSLSAYFATFLDVAEEYVKYNGNQLDGFLTHWEEIDPSISTPDNENAVKLLTIHRSKGLEYPVVILPYLDWKKKLTKDFAWFDPPSPIDELLPKVLLKMTNEILESELEDEMLYEKQKSLLDDINLVYVAFTRAMERLYIYTSSNTGAGNISGEINTALKMMNLELESGVTTFGERRKVIRKEEKSNLYNFPLKVKSRSNQESNLKIAYEFKKYRNEDSRKAIDYGLMVHRLFAEVRTVSDIDPALEKAKRNGLIDKDGYNYLKEKMLRITSQEKVSKWFSDDGEKHIERELVNDAGEELRPDRVYIKDNNVSIIDYKTGNLGEEMMKEYRSQLEKYKKAMRSMGYSNVEGYIIAIDEEQLIPV